MAIVLGLPTRFGGELNIHRSDIRASRTLDGSHSIKMRLDHVWDRIKDWFCNTNLVDAKRQLSVLYNPNASTLEKTDSYFKLMTLVGEGYRDRFEIKPEAFGFSININLGNDITPYSHSAVLCNREYLLEQLITDIAKATTEPDLFAKYQQELVRDLPRAIFSIAGKKIEGLLPDNPGGSDNLAKFQAAIADSLSPTKTQTLAIETLCYQKILAFLMLSSLEINGGVFSNDFIHIKGDGASVFNLTARGDDIELHVNFTSVWQPDILGRSTLLQSPVYDARVLIGPAGEVRLLSAVCGADPIPA